jgi:hypothetical protein
MTGKITPVAPIGARIDMVPIARLLYRRYIAIRPTGPARMAHMSIGSSGSGDLINERMRLSTMVPVTLDINNMLSVDKLRLLRPPIKSAIPQPKQAKIDSVIDITTILLGFIWLNVLIDINVKYVYD